MMQLKDRIIVALDVDTVEQALNLILELGDSVGMYKVGLQLITRAGPEAFARIVQKHSSAQFFYDGKFNDIPNTVAAACRNASQLPGIRFMSVHASAGPTAMRSAQEAAGDVDVLAITVLTSLDDAMCNTIFNECDRECLVGSFASEAAHSGVRGIVCSPKELPMLNAQGHPARRLIKVVPGIRPAWAQSNDHEAFDTPGRAIVDGADYLVIGRPITQPPSAIGSPVAAVHSIVREMEMALDGAGKRV